MGEKYINAFTDFGFKRIFGTEPNKDLLIDFLNQLFLPENKKIVSLTYLPTERLGQIAGDRSGVFDIYCETEKGEKLIVEMQKARQDFFKDRSVFYSTFPIQDQAIRGDWNFKLNAVYTVGILGFNFAEHADDEKYFHHEVKLMDTKRKTVFFDKLTYIYLELPKFNKTEEELENDFERWLYVLKNLHMFDNRPAKIQNRIFKKLFEVAKIAAFTKDEKMAYETSLKHLRDMNNVIDTARREGHEEGIAEGIEKGIVSEKIQTARKMLNDGLSPEIVEKYTGLTLAQIELLANDNRVCETTGKYKSEKPRKKRK
ncbi:MAG: Rpn family recombination-promoting nuclease/putative transposase [Candidatus Riflebacteria bacterium]|nr:Rpn family recombination-promoting nuclease/putative transposase [Candidatus Riflebacteria bacterium]